jgi:hypothetical protein
LLRVDSFAQETRFLGFLVLDNLFTLVVKPGFGIFKKPGFSITQHDNHGFNDEKRVYLGDKESGKS